MNLIKLLRDYSILLYAISLSLGITWQWVFFITGAILSLLLVLTSPQPLNKLKEELKALYEAPLALPLAIFALAITISGWANGGVDEAMRSFTSLRGFLVYFWAYQAFRNNNALKERAVVWAIVTGSIAGIWGMIQQISGFHPNTFHYLQGTGFLSAPMAFAGLAQLLSMLILGLAIHKNYKQLQSPLSKPMLFTLVGAGNIAGVLFAGERSAWLGVLVTLLFSTFLFSWRTTLKMLVALLVVASIVWCTVPVVQTRLATLVHWQNDVSLRVRLNLWQEAIHIFSEKPLCGVGIRNFPHHVISEALGQGHAALDHAHSNYMHILATTGLIGTLAYLFLWLSVVLTAWRNLPDLKDKVWNTETGINFGILAGVISLLVSGIFEFNFGTAQIRLAQWFLIGMLVADRKSNR